MCKIDLPVGMAKCRSITEAISLLHATSCSPLLLVTKSICGMQEPDHFANASTLSCATVKPDLTSVHGQTQSIKPSFSLQHTTHCSKNAAAAGHIGACLTCWRLIEGAVGSMSGCANLLCQTCCAQCLPAARSSQPLCGSDMLLTKPVVACTSDLAPNHDPKALQQRVCMVMVSNTWHKHSLDSVSQHAATAMKPALAEVTGDCYLRTAVSTMSQAFLAGG